MNGLCRDCVVLSLLTYITRLLALLMSDWTESSEIRWICIFTGADRFHWESSARAPDWCACGRLKDAGEAHSLVERGENHLRASVDETPQEAEGMTEVGCDGTPCGGTV